ncbi:MAG TPA: hypothetical protein VFR78_00550 [Pyrinomonadaceae bacterium]|nr:hypothetical protein [Pyrinomonadaceae bacterium]
MNDDYLWDKTGEPDPQIQQLEEILGTLRYQPRPLALPVARRRSYFPVLAIAATVLIALLATGLWLRVRTDSQPQKQQAYVPTPSPVVDERPAKPAEKVGPPRQQQRNRSNQSALSAAKKRERQEALAVKQQLMFALRLASEKLNLAHKKAKVG